GVYHRLPQIWPESPKEDYDSWPRRMERTGKVQQMIGRWRMLSFALVGVGWLASGYLLLRAFELGRGAPIARVDLCSMVFGVGCDARLLGPMSSQLGVPLAGWGFVYFPLLGFLLALGGPSVI